MKILLLEPGYSNKYPPLGLMKIASFHNERGDDVVFAKGKIRGLEPEKFDRVYITTLFTFEWPETRSAIKYAHSYTNPQNIYVGGILATLMPQLVSEEFPGVNIVIGLLNQPGKLGLADDEQIDYLPPCYEILDQIDDQYRYPAANAYFAYTTRGCGMNCSFCAVKILEPEYIPCVSIREQIQEVQKLYGEKRDLRNLLLMDNNVLKSPYLREIVNEIKELGFAKGARYTNPVTLKEVRRSIDFNQGLDANLLTQERANMLAELELRPVRIAFDHIADKQKYITAVERCVKAGLRYFSNYMLYNTDDSSSFKGKKYRADTPEDLYERLVINVKLQEQLNETRTDKDKVSIYSFPMRYIPLEATSRGFIGTNWNAKMLRAIQVMLNPTQGKGISGRSFFSAAFGADLDEFRMNLLMPENILVKRGKFVENKKGETAEAKHERYTEWKLNQAIWKKWVKLFKTLSDKQTLYDLVADNSFSLDKLIKQSEDLQRLYIYYFSESHLLDIFSEAAKTNYSGFVTLIEEETELLKTIQRYIRKTAVPISRLEGYFYFFGLLGIEDVMMHRSIPGALRDSEDNAGKELLNQWEAALIQINKPHFFTLVHKGITNEIWLRLSERSEKLASLYYLEPGAILELLSQLELEGELIWLRGVLGNSVWQQVLGQYVYDHTHQVNSRIISYLKSFGNSAEVFLIKLWFTDPNKPAEFTKTLERALIQIRRDPTRAELLSVTREYWEIGILGPDKMEHLEKLFIVNNTEAIRIELKESFPEFRKAVLAGIPDDPTADIAKNAAEVQLNRFYHEFLSRMW